MIAGMENKGHIPSSIVGGETIWVSSANVAQGCVDITFDGYTPADGYALSYQFAAETPATVAAVENGTGTGWTLEVPSATTLAWIGKIAFTGIVTKSSRSFVVDYGTVIVAASPLRVSQWRSMIEKIDAAMLTSAKTANGSISVDGMSVSYKSVADLKALREFAERKLREETGAKLPSRILSRFTI